MSDQKPVAFKWRLVNTETGEETGWKLDHHLVTDEHLALLPWKRESHPAYLQPAKPERAHEFKPWMVDELMELAEALPEDMERINRIAAAIASLFEEPTP